MAGTGRPLSPGVQNCAFDAYWAVTHDGAYPTPEQVADADLRKKAAKHIEENWAVFAPLYQERLIAAFNAYCAESSEEDDTFCVHPHIKTKFNEIKAKPETERADAIQAYATKEDEGDGWKKQYLINMRGTGEGGTASWGSELEIHALAIQEDITIIVDNMAGRRYQTTVGRPIASVPDDLKETYGETLKNRGIAQLVAGGNYAITAATYEQLKKRLEAVPNLTDDLRNKLTALAGNSEAVTKDSLGLTEDKFSETLPELVARGVVYRDGSDYKVHQGDEYLERLGDVDGDETRVQILSAFEEGIKTAKVYVMIHYSGHWVPGSKIDVSRLADRVEEGEAVEMEPGEPSDGEGTSAGPGAVGASFDEQIAEAIQQSLESYAAEQESRSTPPLASPSPVLSTPSHRRDSSLTGEAVVPATAPPAGLRHAHSASNLPDVSRQLFSVKADSELSSSAAARSTPPVERPDSTTHQVLTELQTTISSVSTNRAEAQKALETKAIGNLKFSQENGNVYLEEDSGKRKLEKGEMEKKQILDDAKLAAKLQAEELVIETAPASRRRASR